MLYVPPAGLPPDRATAPEEQVVMLVAVTVGFALTVTVAAPLFPVPATPFALVTDTNVYVLVDAGDTGIFVLLI